MIYFDNAATTKYKPFCVKTAVIKSLFFYSANPGRSAHKLSIKCAEQVFLTRKAVSSFFNLLNSERVVFTSGCSEALNLAILGSCKENGHVITTAYEHNSTLRPLQFLKETKNVDFSIVNPQNDGKLLIGDFEKLIRSNTYAIIVNHTSNVTGITQNLKEIGTLCKKYNLIFIVDSAQSAGHTKIDMKKDNISMLAFASHKGLHGVQGLGGLCVQDNIALSPIKFGGTGTSSFSLSQPTNFPEGFEVGTINLPAILALKNAIAFTEKNFNKINNKIMLLSNYFYENLIKCNDVYFPPCSRDSGLFSFSVKGIPSSTVASLLDSKFNICVRSGYHCAPLVHKFYNSEDGLVRVSLDYKNTTSEIDKFFTALRKIIEENK